MDALVYLGDLLFYTPGVLGGWRANSAFVECQTLYEHKHRKFFNVSPGPPGPQIVGNLEQEGLRADNPEGANPICERIISQLDESEVLAVKENQSEVHDSMVRVFLHSSGIYNYVQRLRDQDLDTTQIRSVLPSASQHLVLAAYVSSWLEISMNETLGASQYLRRLCTSESE